MSCPRIHLRSGAQQLALSCNPLLILPSLRQGTLDDIVTWEPKVPAFTTNGLLDHVVELVVCEDEVRLLIYHRCYISQGEPRHSVLLIDALFISYFGIAGPPSL